MKLFINQCIKNREFMEFTYKDMSNFLKGVSEDDYHAFENGTYNMSKENLDRIVRVLCVKRSEEFDVSKYLNTEEYDQDEIEDLSKVISSIVGDDND